MILCLWCLFHPLSKLLAISSLRGLLLSGCRYPRGVVIFGDQKPTLTSMVYRTTERVKSNSSLSQGRRKLNSVLLVHDKKKNAFYSQELSGWWAPLIVQYAEVSVLTWRNVPVLYMSISYYISIVFTLIVQSVNWRQRRMIVSGMPRFPCCKVPFRDKFVNARRS